MFAIDPVEPRPTPRDFELKLIIELPTGSIAGLNTVCNDYDFDPALDQHK